MKLRLVFLHTSPAAIAPLNSYYQANAPEFEITNLLDDGVLRCFAAADEGGAECRLAELLRYAVRHEGARLVMVTCSAVTRALMNRISASAGIPVLKIDDALARRAVASGPRLGVIVTFPPSQAATERLLRETAEECGTAVQLRTLVLPEAYDALLNGQAERHDEMLIDAVERLRREGVGAVVLSQVSMARILPRVPDSPVPVLSSLPASLEAIREALAA